MESDAAFHVGIAAASPTELGIVAHVVSIKASEKCPDQWVNDGLTSASGKHPGSGWSLGRGGGGKHREKKAWYHQRPAPYSQRTSYSRVGAEEMTGARASPASLPESQASSPLRSKSQRLFFYVSAGVYVFVGAGVCGSLWRPGQTQVSFLRLCVQRPEASLWESALGVEPGSSGLAASPLVRFHRTILLVLMAVFTRGDLIRQGMLMKVCMFVCPALHPGKSQYRSMPSRSV